MFPYECSTGTTNSVCPKLNSFFLQNMLFLASNSLSWLMALPFFCHSMQTFERSYLISSFTFIQLVLTFCWFYLVYCLPKLLCDTATALTQSISYFDSLTRAYHPLLIQSCFFLMYKSDQTFLLALELSSQHKHFSMAIKTFPEEALAISSVASPSYSFLFPTYLSYETTHIIGILFYISLQLFCFESPFPALL